MSDAAGRAGLRREWAAALAVALLAVVVALWPALAAARTHTLGAWDWLAQASSLTREEPLVAPAHTEILDPVRQMVPWALIAREQLASGELPLWNPYNGAGGPLLGNYQSALLSPFTWPFYALPLGAALLVSAALKLAALAVGMFLFLRELRLSRSAAALGAFAFSTAGFQLMCLLHPHVGVIACLPPALIAVERAFARWRERPGRTPWRPLAALALCLGLMVLAGHPETLLFCVYTVAAFAGLRVVQAARAGLGTRPALRLALGLVAAGLAGAAIGAVQLAPFVELYFDSALARGEGRNLARFPVEHALLWFFPDAAGSPMAGGIVGPMLAANYQEVNSLHLGGWVSALALVAPLVLRRDATGWFFLALGGAALLAVLDLPGLNALNDALFFLEWMPSTRVNPLWLVGGSVAASLVVERALLGDGRRWIAVLAASAGVLIAARFGVSAWWNSAREQLAAQLDPRIGVLAERADTLLAILTAGLAALALLRFARAPWARVAALGLVLAALAAERSYVFGGFMPVVEDRLVLPRTAATERFAADTRGERVAFLTADSLPVNANGCYGVELLPGYEILEEHRLAQLREELLGVTSHLSGTHFASRRALDLFGVEHVVTRGAWLPVDTESCSGLVETQSRWVLAGEYGLPRKPRFAVLDAGRPKLTQKLRPGRDGLSALALLFHDTPQARAAHVALELRESEAAQPLVSRSIALSELRALPGERLECVLEFDALASSAGREFTLTIQLERGPSDAPVELFRAWRPGAAAEGERSAPSDAADADSGRARLVQDMAYGRGGFDPPQPLAALERHRYAAGRGKAWLVAEALSARDGEHAHELVLAPEFDPRRTVVLEGGGGATSSAELALEVERASPSSAAYRARCSAAAFLVLSQPFLPGWRARVDGRDVPLLRANYAFSALPLPAGESWVELEYCPRSVSLGALVSLLALLAALMALMRARPE